MTIMHVFTLAGAGHYTPGITQLRYHQCIPWDEAYKLYLDPTALDALLALAIAAAKDGGLTRLRGRVFDVLRMVRESQPTTPPQSSIPNRDRGPFAVVTTSATMHRIELEDELRSWTDADWMRAMELGRKLSRLLQGVTDKI